MGGFFFDFEAVTASRDRSGLARPVCSVRGRSAGCGERGCRGGVAAMLGAALLQRCDSAR